MDMRDQNITPAGEFAEQLLRQVYADLGGVLSLADASASDDAFELIAKAAIAGGPRGASLVVLLQAARRAYDRLLSDSADDAPGPAASEISEELQLLLPAAAKQLVHLDRHARRLCRYAGETEPAAAALPAALADAIVQLYEGLAGADHRRSGIGLIALRTLVVHVDAIASQLDPAETGDRPVRVFAPDRFHDYFMQLTELVQKAQPSGNDRAVAALTRDGRLTAVITQADHPLASSATAIREQIPGDAITREHALLRMQGLLHCIDQLRATPTHPWADALEDESRYLSLVTAAATAPMIVPGRFGWPQLAQVARHNLNLLHLSNSPTERPH